MSGTHFGDIHFSRFQNNPNAYLWSSSENGVRLVFISPHNLWGKRARVIQVQEAGRGWLEMSTTDVTCRVTLSREQERTSFLLKLICPALLLGCRAQTVSKLSLSLSVFSLSSPLRRPQPSLPSLLCFLPSLSPLHLFSLFSLLQRGLMSSRIVPDSLMYLG